MNFNLYKKKQSSTKVSRDWIKQELFVRTHYVEGLAREFEKVRLLPTRKKRLWIKENEQLLGDVLDGLVFDSDLAVDGVTLVTQVATMSMDFVTKLKRTALLMKQIMRENDKLKN